MKTFTVVMIFILALILGTTSAALLNRPGEHELLRLTEALVCPQGSRYQFTTRLVSDVDPQTSAPITISQLNIECAAAQQVTIPDVTRQAERIFWLILVAGWAGLFLLIWLASTVFQFVRRNRAS